MNRRFLSLRTVRATPALLVVVLVLASPVVNGALVVNGGFETTTHGAGQLAFNTAATGWTSAMSGSDYGYNFIFGPTGNAIAGGADTAGAVGNQGTVKLWGPGSSPTAPNGLTSSPDGGNFLAADPVYQSGAISQTINGLTAGNQYAVSFYWAGAQQSGFSGATTEGWQVSFGSQSPQSTTIANNPDQGFTGWFSQTFTFTADAASDVLSFLALGGPSSGLPPFVLLDGVAVNAVPELGSLSIWGVFGLVGFAACRFGRRAKTPKA